LPLKLIGQFEISRIAVDGNGVGAVEGHHVSYVWKNQAGVLVQSRRGVRKNRQNEESESQGRPPKTATTQLEHGESPFLKE
jgi:sRNA-binding protein